MGRTLKDPFISGRRFRKSMFVKVSVKATFWESVKRVVSWGYVWMNGCLLFSVFEFWFAELWLVEGHYFRGNLRSAWYSKKMKTYSLAVGYRMFPRPNRMPVGENERYFHELLVLRNPTLISVSQTLFGFKEACQDLLKYKYLSTILFFGPLSTISRFVWSINIYDTRRY
jgi:hypothetical protein